MDELKKRGKHMRTEIEDASTRLAAVLQKPRGEHDGREAALLAQLRPLLQTCRWESLLQDDKKCERKRRLLHLAEKAVK